MDWFSWKGIIDLFVSIGGMKGALFALGVGVVVMVMKESILILGRQAAARLQIKKDLADREAASDRDGQQFLQDMVVRFEGRDKEHAEVLVNLQIGMQAQTDALKTLSESTAKAFDKTFEKLGRIHEDLWRTSSNGK